MKRFDNELFAGFFFDTIDFHSKNNKALAALMNVILALMAFLMGTLFYPLGVGAIIIASLVFYSPIIAYHNSIYSGVPDHIYPDIEYSIIRLRDRLAEWSRCSDAEQARYPDNIVSVVRSWETMNEAELVALNNSMQNLYKDIVKKRGNEITNKNVINAVKTMEEGLK